MSRQTYADMLRDPRWQRKRLEIMQRDEFKCRECGDGTTTLNVHHTYYATGRKPWEYEDSALKTLCQPCHEAVTIHLAEIQQNAGSLASYDLERMVGYSRALAVMTHWSMWDACGDDTPAIEINSDTEFYGVLDALCGVTEEELYQYVGNDPDHYEPLHWHQYRQIFTAKAAARVAEEPVAP